jgi:hypothetical protein
MGRLHDFMMIFVRGSRHFEMPWLLGQPYEYCLELPTQRAISCDTPIKPDSFDTAAFALRQCHPDKLETAERSQHSIGNCCWLFAFLSENADIERSILAFWKDFCHG